MPQYTNRDIIICGMPAQSMTLKQQIDCIDVTSAYDIEPPGLRRVAFLFNLKKCASWRFGS